MSLAQGPHSLQALQARYGERHRWLLLLSVMLGSMAAGVIPYPGGVAARHATGE